MANSKFQFFVSILFIAFLLNFAASNDAVQENAESDQNRPKRWGGWGGGTYRYGPCGYGGCGGGGGYGYGGGWVNMGYGYGMRPAGWRPWRTGGGGGGGSHSAESFG